MGWMKRAGFGSPAKPRWRSVTRRCPAAPPPKAPPNRRLETARSGALGETRVTGVSAPNEEEEIVASTAEADAATAVIAALAATAEETGENGRRIAAANAAQARIANVRANNHTTMFWEKADRQRFAFCFLAGRVSLEQDSHTPGSVPAKDEAVVNPLGLVVFERGQFGERRRLCLVQHGPGHCLQGSPPRPFQFRSMGDLP